MIGLNNVMTGCFTASLHALGNKSMNQDEEDIGIPNLTLPPRSFEAEAT